jgi:hypothetical protein
MGRSLTLEIEGQMSKVTTLEQAEDKGREEVEAAVRKTVEEIGHVRWIPRRA